MHQTLVMPQASPKVVIGAAVVVWTSVWRTTSKPKLQCSGPCLLEPHMSQQICEEWSSLSHLIPTFAWQFSQFLHKVGVPMGTALLLMSLVHTTFNPNELLHFIQLRSPQIRIAQNHYNIVIYNQPISCRARWTGPKERGQLLYNTHTYIYIHTIPT